jgi:hypothetical protein
MQTLIAHDHTGRIFDHVEIKEGKGRRATPRKIKKWVAFASCGTAARFSRVTTRTLDGARNARAR